MTNLDNNFNGGKTSKSKNLTSPWLVVPLDRSHSLSSGIHDLILISLWLSHGFYRFSPLMHPKLNLVDPTERPKLCKLKIF